MINLAIWSQCAVLIQRVGEPDSESRPRRASAVFLAAIEDHIAPVASPVLPVLFVGQQSVDRRGSLTGRSIEGETNYFLRRGHRADEVERHAAVKNVSSSTVSAGRGASPVPVAAKMFLGQERVDVGRPFALGSAAAAASASPARRPIRRAKPGPALPPGFSPDAKGNSVGDQEVGSCRLRGSKLSHRQPPPPPQANDGRFALETERTAAEKTALAPVM